MVWRCSLGSDVEMQSGLWCGGAVDGCGLGRDVEVCPWVWSGLWCGSVVWVVMWRCGLGCDVEVCPWVWSGS